MKSPRTNSCMTIKLIRKTTSFLFLSACAFVSATSSAYAFTSASELYSACSSLESLLKGTNIAPEELQKTGICMGFIEAGADGLSLGAIAGSGAKASNSQETQKALMKSGVPFACVPFGKLSSGEIMRIFLRYYENNSDTINKQPTHLGSGMGVLMKSLVDAYPCKQA